MNLRPIVAAAMAFVVILGAVGFAPCLARAQMATSTAENATTTRAIEQRWDGLEQLQIMNFPFSSSLIRERIGQLPGTPVQSLPIPVLFGVSRSNLIQNYGDPRGSGRTHEGLDIPVPKGAPIVSPTPAVVLSAGTGISSGNTVSTANPGGETFVYMHLDRIAGLKAGDILAPGDLIGYAGNTGNAAGGAAHLHFEIRKNGATNPYPRLTGEFTLSQKMAFAAAILAASENKLELAQFFAANYPDQFRLAIAAGISVPGQITANLPLAQSASNIEQLKAKIVWLKAQILSLQQQLLKMKSAALADAISVQVTVADQTKNIAAGNSIAIAAGDMLAFQIVVANAGTTAVNSVRARNNFPAGITSWQNVLVDGAVVPGAIDKELLIGSLAVGQKKTITCTASAGKILPSTASIDIAVAFNDAVWGRATAQVIGE